MTSFSRRRPDTVEKAPFGIYLTFLCPRCKTQKSVSGRKLRYANDRRGGFICKDCVEKRNAKT